MFRHNLGWLARVARGTSLIAIALAALASGVVLTAGPVAPSEAAAPSAFRLPFVGHATWATYPTHSPSQYARDIVPKYSDPKPAWDGQVLAAAAGKVIYAREQPDTNTRRPKDDPCPDKPFTYGNVVVIQHDIGGVLYQSVYAHLSTIAVAENTTVSAGATLGVYGNTGCVAGPTGIHLHFEIRERSTPDKPFTGTWIDIDNLPGVIKLGQTTGGGDAVGPPLAAPTTSVDVALIIDSSASMRGNDPANRRLDAGRAYVNASVDGDRIAVIDFATSATVDLALSPRATQQPQLIAAINAIRSDGSDTNIRDGVDKACAELLAHGTAGRRGAILLTDGQHNVGSFGNPQQCFKDHGWPIYTFGFGQADATLLSAIASDTGGAFTMAPTSNLVCEFQNIRARIANVAPGPCAARNVQPNQTTTFLASVAANQQQVTFASSWSGSDIAMSLVLPSGRVIDRTTNAADVTHDLSPTFESYAITNPEPGEWQVRLFGLDVPPQGEDAVVNVVAIPKPPVTVTPPPATTPRSRRTPTPRPATQTAIPTAAPATATVAPPTQAPPATATRVTGVLGAVKPPNTGTGYRQQDSNDIARLLAAMIAAGTICLAAGAMIIRRQR